MIPALLLALAAPAPAAGFVFTDATIVHALPSPDELAASMREGAREERLEAVNRASGMIGGFDSNGQLTVIRALREQAESPSAPGEVRGKAFVVLGEQMTWLRDDYAKREAAGALLDALEATPGDSREGYRRQALKGLWSASGRLPQDETLENRVASVLLSSAESSDGAERTFALCGLDALLRSRPRVAAANRAGPRLRSVVLDPIARDPSAFSGDGRRDGDERFAAVRVLADLAWASEDAGVRVRVRDVMGELAQLDSNPSLRRIADLWSRSIRA